MGFRGGDAGELLVEHHSNLIWKIHECEKCTGGVEKRGTGKRVVKICLEKVSSVRTKRGAIPNKSSNGPDRSHCGARA
jgi:hypothetical protein